VLLKNASKWAFKIMEESGKKINEAEENLYFRDKDERK
jgi:hypothetical protein